MAIECWRDVVVGGLCLFDSQKSFVENFSHIAATIGVILVFASLVAVAVQISMTRTRNISDRDQQAYSTSNGAWVKYLDHCYENIDQDIYDFSHAEIRELLKKRGSAHADERLLYDFKKMLISMSKLINTMETAYVLYSHEGGLFRKTQWSGWEEFIRMYFQRDQFYEVFDIVSPAYAEDFCRYMQRLYDEETARRKRAP